MTYTGHSTVKPQAASISPKKHTDEIRIMKKGSVTIKDLARKLNISVSTVSRALRNATDINPQTREKVLALAHELSY